MTRILAVIPARGGSKGVVRKNLRNLGGIPLIAHTIRAAAGAGLLTRTIVSTDDAEIAETARKFGADVPFFRPAELASDIASSVGVATHALRFCEGCGDEPYDILVLLQPTSPFRSSGDIDGTLRLLIDKAEMSSAITVAPMGGCNPNYLYRKNSRKELWEPVSGPSSIGKRRQDMESLFIRTGAVYAVRCSYLLEQNQLMSDKPLAWIMSEEASINIDSEFDLFLANAMAEFKNDRGRYGK